MSERQKDHISVSDQEIEGHIRKAFLQIRETSDSGAEDASHEHLTIKEEAYRLWEKPAVPAKGDEPYLAGTESFGTGEGSKTDDRGSRRKPRVHKGGRSILSHLLPVAAAALVILCALGGYQLCFKRYETICLDVNPSVTMSVNRIGRVIRAEANNEDAGAVISGVKLGGKKTDEAARIILSEMKKKGYLEQNDGCVLLTMDLSNPGAADSYDEFTDEMGEYLQNITGESSLFCQETELDEDMYKYALQYSISPGKVALIRQICESNPDLKEEYLASLSISELAHYLHSQNIDLRDYLKYSGTDLEQIWREKDARQKAAEEAEAAEAAQELREAEEDAREGYTSDDDDDDRDDADDDHEDDDRDDADDDDQDADDRYDADDSDYDADDRDDTDDAYDDTDDSGDDDAYDNDDDDIPDDVDYGDDWEEDEEDDD